MLRPMVRVHLAPQKSPAQRPFFRHWSSRLSSADSRLWSEFTLAQLRESASSAHTFRPVDCRRVSAALRNDWSEPGGGRDGEVPAQAADLQSSDGGQIEVHHSCTTSAVVNGGRVPADPRLHRGDLDLMRDPLVSPQIADALMSADPSLGNRYDDSRGTVSDGESSVSQSVTILLAVSGQVSTGW